MISPSELVEVENLEFDPLDEKDQMIFSNIVCKKSSNKASRETLKTSDIDQYLNLMNFVKQNSNERKLVKSSDIAL